ncbi:hypothetical protein [Acidimangrovimonas sediminis]|uniref:hypothetical protein n=1 Tax=Acidimangrovimonas sediminis TaxID=2056283 RepID=UPI000C80F30C|nr:hypothetical protein [Acidimangrovimonas sediminis]
MARLPRKPTALIEDSCWAVALRLGTFGYSEIAAEAHVSHERASAVVRRWLDAGRCELVQRKHEGAKRNLYRVDPKAAPKQRPTGSVPQNLWNSMRGLKHFTPVDLAAHSTTPTVLVTVEAARAYCQALLRANYLRAVRRAVPGQREATYQLIRNTGPRPPRERRVRAVWDENLEDFTHVARASK